MPEVTKRGQQSRVKCTSSRSIHIPCSFEQERQRTGCERQIEQQCSTNFGARIVLQHFPELVQDSACIFFVAIFVFLFLFAFISKTAQTQNRLNSDTTFFISETSKQSKSD